MQTCWLVSFTHRSQIQSSVVVIGHIAGKQSFHLVLPLARWESSEQAHSVYRSELEHGVKRARGRPRGKEGTDLEKPGRAGGVSSQLSFGRGFDGGCMPLRTVV